MSCVRRIAKTKQLSSAITSMALLADYCQVALRLKEWPAKSMCQHVKDSSDDLMTEYSGTNCSTVCYFGKATNDTCSCDHGYWDQDCSKVCPGGATEPCFGHGYCSPDNGECDCDANWQGDANCSACSLGFNGPDCLISLQKYEVKMSYVAKIFANNYMQTFDNVFVAVSSYGEYTALQQSTIGLQLNLLLVQRFSSVSLIGVALRMKQSTVIIHAGVSQRVFVTANNKVVNIDAKLTFPGGYKFARISHDCIAIKGPGGLEISVYNRSRSLSLEIAASVGLCQESKGIFGNCKPSDVCKGRSSSCDFSSLSSYNISDLTASKIEQYLKQWEVTKVSSLFAEFLVHIGASLHQTNAQTCLHFDRSGIVTSPLHGVFTGRYISIQLMIRVDSSINAGTIISFAQDSTLSFVLNGTVRVHRENINIDTGLAVVDNRWTQLTVVYHKITGVLQLFTKSDLGISQAVVYFVGLGWLEDGLSIGIGITQVSRSKAVSLMHSLFSGYVDDVKIWTRRLDSVTIDSHWTSDIDIHDKELKALWKMDEGTGIVIHDSAGASHISMPPRGWMLPRWVDANYTLDATHHTPVRKHQALKGLAESRCREHLFDDDLQRVCISVFNDSNPAYYRACVESVLAENSTTAADDTLLSYASSCQQLLNLTSNPGQHLCNHTSSKRIGKYYGINCSQICDYGDVIGNTCVCYKGYWGVNCSNECPGGASEPCHNHGVCLQGYGHCVCDYNWRGDVNCSSCTIGWESPHCLRAESPNTLPSKQVCYMGRSGLYRSFNGTQQSLSRSGEYLVVNSTSLQVRALTVDCFKDAVCLTSLNVRSGSLEISLRRSPKSIRSQLFVSQRYVDMELSGFLRVSKDLSVSAVSPGSYRIVIKDALKIDISAGEFYYSMTLESQKASCRNVNGLCGSCHLGTASPLVPLSTPEFLYYGQFSLYFEKSTLYTEEIDVFSRTQATIELTVKSCDSKVCGGPMFTFASRRVVYVSNYHTVKVYVAGTMFDSGITTTINEWNHILISFDGEQRKMDVYIAVSNARLYHRSFLLQVYPFTAPGIISIGSWTPSASGLDEQTLRTFTGEIDEFRIWDRYFDYSMVKQRIFANIDSRIPGLRAAWKMNEGSGLKMKDLVGESDLFAPEYPLEKPKWRLSTSPIASPLRKVSFKDDTDLRVTADRFCQDIILRGHIGDVCKDITETSKQFYVSNCIHLIVKRQQKTASLYAIVEYADYCKKRLSLLDWPARPLCNIFKGVKFPNWIGTNCSVMCVFGNPSYRNANLCVCDNGYWGLACSKTCGGGFSRPCSNHGICDPRTGKCTCDSNWNGDRNCSICSTGFTGDDCTVAVATLTRSQSNHASVSLKGFMTLFGGYGIVLRQAGEYRMVYSAKHSIAVYGRFVPCFNKEPCLNSLVFRYLKNELVLRAPYRLSENIIVWLNRRLIDIYTDKDDINARHIQIIRKAASTYVVIHPLGEYAVSVVGTYLTLDTNVNEDVCNSSYGVLGSCARNISDVINAISLSLNCSNDNVTEYAEKRSRSILPVNATNIIDFTKRHRLKSCNSPFIYKYKDINEYRDANAGYALRFNASSLVLLDWTVLNNKVCTIDFMMNIEQDGTIFSYGSITTFLLVTVNFELQIWIGEEVFRTRLYAERSAWNQVIMQWSKERNQFKVFLVDQLGNQHRKDVNISRNQDVFHRGGVFGIGQWQPAFNYSYARPNGSFVGLIDQFRVWDREFSPAVVWQLWRRELRNDSKYLKAKINFDNVDEGYVIDEVSKRVIVLPGKPWIKPVKVFAELVQEEQLGVAENRGVNIDWIRKSEIFCSQFTLEGPLNTHCGVLGKGIGMFYYRLCVKMVSEKGDLYTGIHAIVSYSGYCQSVLKLAYWPARDLCGSFEAKRLPKQMLEQCTEGCMYGISSLEGTCECIKGYWGKRCDAVCPGGGWNPCNEKGICGASSGKCKCEINWSGDEQCRKCSNGWVGKDCRIAQVGNSIIQRSTEERTFVIGGAVMLHSGHLIAFNYIGQYLIYRNTVLNIEVNMWQVPCYIHTLCIQAIKMRFASLTVVITAPMPDASAAAVVFVNDRIVTVTSKYLTYHSETQTISVRYAGRNELQIDKSNVRFALVRVFSRSLSIFVDVKDNNCSISGGILATCINRTENTSANNLAEEWYRKWKIQTSENAVGISEVISSVSAAEYAILVENTGAVSNPLCSSFEDGGDRTLELLVKPMSQQFVIMSYSSRRTFAVYVNETFRIATSTMALDSKIKAVNGTWQHLSIIWWSQVKRLDFFVLGNNETLHRRTFKLQTDPFFSCGILTLGQWMPSLLMPKGPEIASGKFCVDEIRVWNRTFDPLMVQQNYKMNVLKSHPGLKALWKVNEFDGDIIYNLMNRNESIHMPNQPWQKPYRVLSTARVRQNTSDVFHVSAEVNSSSTAISKHCKKLFYRSEIWTKCQKLPSLLSYFYGICVRDAVLKNTSFAVYSVVTFADACKILLNLTTWPAKSLCHHFTDIPLPLWIGNNCNNLCVFGSPSPLNASECVCDRGYWGKDCSQQCPGGASSPCSGNGECQKTGKCICELNWSGNSNCSSCGVEWLGPFCNISIEPFKFYKEKSLAVSFITSTGQITTFNGYTINSRIADEIILMHSRIKHLLITAKGSPCSIANAYYSRCLTFVTVRHFSLSIVIRAPYLIDSNNARIVAPILMVNNKLVDVGHFTYIDAKTVMRRVRRNIYVIAASGIFELRITVRQALGVSIKLSREYCKNATGILGTCDSKREKLSALLERTLMPFYLAVSDSAIKFDKYHQYREGRTVYGSLYTAYLNDTGLVSTPFTTLNHPVLTVELQVKTFKHGGVLLAYVSKNIFAVSNEAEIRMFIGSDVIRTGLATDIGE